MFDIDTMQEVHDFVFHSYLNQYGLVDGPTIFNEQGNLLYIRRFDNQTFEDFYRQYLEQHGQESYKD